MDKSYHINIINRSINFGKLVEWKCFCRFSKLNIFPLYFCQIFFFIYLPCLHCFQIHIHFIHSLEFYSENIHFYCKSSGSAAVVRVLCRLYPRIFWVHRYIRSNATDRNYGTSTLNYLTIWNGIPSFRSGLVENHSRGECKSFWYSSFSDQTNTVLGPSNMLNQRQSNWNYIYLRW